MMAEAKDRQVKQKSEIYPPLPKLEMIIYFILWIGSYFCAVIQVYYMSSSKAYIRKAVRRRDLEIRYNYLIRSYQLKDILDFEWDLWNYWVWEMIICAYTFHFIMMRICEKINNKYRFHSSMLYCFAFCVYFFGVKGLLLIISQSLICFSMAYFTKSVAITWISSLLLIVPLNNSYTVAQLQEWYDDDWLLVMFVCACSMCNLRYIAFCLEYCWSCKSNQNIASQNDGESDANDETKSFHQVFLDLLLYQFYFPLFTGGPVINYNEFCSQIEERPPSSWNVSCLFKYFLGIARYGFWHLVINFLLHKVYFASINSDVYEMKTVPLLALCGLALCFVQFFSMKYMVMYGLPSKVAIADNLDIPGASHCVSSKHRFTDMWKYFDRGLHKWLVRYIFIPLGGSKGENGILWNTVTSMLPFAFVYFWHGARADHLVWAGLNWFGVFIEGVALKVYMKEEVQLFEKKYLSPANSRRFRAAISTMPFSLLIISNLYFLAGIETGNVYMRRIYTEDLFSTFVIHVVLYFGAQTSMELTRYGF